MRLSFLSLWAGFATTLIRAEDFLFVTGHTGGEYTEALALGYSVRTVSETEWAGMATTDFASFRAIIIGGDYCQTNDSTHIFLEQNTDVWSPAVQGNILIIGNPVSASYEANYTGAKTFIDNALDFVAAGTTAAGQQLTGLYFPLGCYDNSKYYNYYYVDATAYADDAPTGGTSDTYTITALSYFGNFVGRVLWGCIGTSIHAVAQSDVLASLNDTLLSNWACTGWEGLTSYSSTGSDAFEVLAISEQADGEGVATFGDDVSGIPYIVARTVPAPRCGDGVWNSRLEECDDGNTVDGDGCSSTCICESGMANGDGTCAPAPSLLPSGTGIFIPTGIIIPPIIPRPTGFRNNTCNNMTTTVTTTDTTTVTAYYNATRSWTPRIRNHTVTETTTVTAARITAYVSKTVTSTASCRSISTPAPYEPTPDPYPPPPDTYDQNAYSAPDPYDQSNAYAAPSSSPAGYPPYPKPRCEGAQRGERKKKLLNDPVAGAIKETQGDD